MSCTISERDWKVFRELRQVALERLCEKILAQAQSLIVDPHNSSHQRYLNLYQLINKRDDDIASGFNDFRRSTALLHMGVIHAMGLWRDEELHQFSQEALQILALYAPVPDA